MNYYRNKWNLSISGHEAWLFNEEKPTVFPVVDAWYLLKALNEKKPEYCFYCFTEGTEQEKYVFVTSEDINLSVLEKTWGTRDESFIVEGALFDLQRREFITIKDVSPTKKGYFYNFVIYDAGIPHIICDDEKDEYVILYKAKTDFISFHETRSSCVPTVATYCSCKGKNSIKRNRILFFEEVGTEEEQCDFMALQRDLSLVRTQNKASLVRCLYDRKTAENQPAYLHSLPVGKEARFNFKRSKGVKELPMNTFLLGGNSCLIVRSPYGEYGEYVLLIVDGEVYYNNSLSFYDYEVVMDVPDGYQGHLVLKLYYEKSDFENGIAYFDVTERLLHNELNSLYA